MTDTVKKLTSKTGFRLAVVGLLALILLAVTNPSRDTHAEKVFEAGKESGTLGSVLGGALDAGFGEYNNYVFLSTFGTEEGTRSIGILGVVIVL